ncbi:AAA-like domain-containing protein, partial [Limnofasciculus baicalensis]
LPTPHSPLPQIPGGQVPLDSAFYIERSSIENRCYNTITQPGGLIRIHSPRQMGKTSLMARILHQAREEGYRTVTLSFQLAGSNIFTNLDRFLQWFCASVGKSLGLPNRLVDYWDDIIGGNSSATDYFENYLLAEINSPVVLAIDEFDCLCQYQEIASDFLGLLRNWYEKAKYGNSLSDVWQKLRLVVVHSSTTNISQNINLSPFNIGLSIELPEFTPEEIQDLANRHGLNWDNDKVEKLMSLVGGYPYLVQKALYHIAHQDVTLEELMPKSASKGRVYGEHLHQQLLNLQLYPELLAALDRVVSSTTPVELNRIPALKLRSMGLVRLMGGNVVPSCDLYRQYFLNCHS